MRHAMRSWIRCLLPLLLLAAATPPLLAQQSGDPLSDDEIEQIRENAIRPVERLKLYMKFIDQRIDEIKQLSSDHRVTNRPAQLRSKFEEFTRLCDELQDNLDTYDSAHADIRKALKDLVPDTVKWPDTLNLAGSDPAWDFARKTALAAAQSAGDEAKELQTEQEKYFADHKDERNKNGNGPG